MSLFYEKTNTLRIISNSIFASCLGLHLSQIFLKNTLPPGGTQKNFKRYTENKFFENVSFLVTASFKIVNQNGKSIEKYSILDQFLLVILRPVSLQRSYKESFIVLSFSLKFYKERSILTVRVCR